MKPKFKALIVLGIEFVAIVVILILILFQGKKVYTVTFDLNGGTLISGELVQRVTQGQNATAPNVTKDGCYLLEWSNSYFKVTHNVTTRAIWEYDTTEGIEYEIVEDSNYCMIKRCFPDITGDVYIGAYYDNKKVLGIDDFAFKDCKYVTGVYLLDGILNIGESAFEGCESLEVIDIPSTTVNIKKNAFKGCKSLKEVKLNEGLMQYYIYFALAYFLFIISLTVLLFYIVVNVYHITLI